MNHIQVDKETFDALQLAQNTIRYVHARTPLGSPNQVSHVQKGRDGKQTDARVISVYEQTENLFRELEKNQPDEFVKLGLRAGIALLSETGDCRLLNYLAFSYLLKNAPVGMTLKVNYFKVIDESAKPHTGGNGSAYNHYCVSLSWPGCKDEVICDTWPTKAQACLKHHYFGLASNQREAFIKKLRKDLWNLPQLREGISTPWVESAGCTVSSIELTGQDLVYEAFSKVRPSDLRLFFDAPISPSATSS